MAITYEVITDPRFNTESIKKTDENGQEFWIPIEPANSDYQRYLVWLENPEAEQSTPIATAEDLKALGL
jgi:hypothetical protein